MITKTFTATIGVGAGTAYIRPALLEDFGVFWSFLKILEYFSHFYFSGILVILIIGWVGVYP